MERGGVVQRSRLYLTWEALTADNPGGTGQVKAWEMWQVVLGASLGRLVGLNRCWFYQRKPQPDEGETAGMRSDVKK
jgi:hypothetical protein